jgi:flagellar protein FlaG
MDLEIHGANAATQHISKEKTQRPRPEASIEQADGKAVAKKIAQAAEESAEKSNQNRSTQQYLKEIIDFTQFYDKRLKFSVNEELDQVVVKVIDAQTDRVIKEIPPEALQRLHLRIREAIGLLIDEFI